MFIIRQMDKTASADGLLQPGSSGALPDLLRKLLELLNGTGAMK
jgi:hypothetical protein